MMKAEFEKFYNAEVSAEIYAEIEYVYNFHPAIPDVGGKQKIADIFRVGGIGVIRSMRPVAEMAEKAEKEILHKRHQIAEIEKEIAEIRATLRPYEG